MGRHHRFNRRDRRLNDGVARHDVRSKPGLLRNVARRLDPAVVYEGTSDVAYAVFSTIFFGVIIAAIAAFTRLTSSVR